MNRLRKLSRLISDFTQTERGRKVEKFVGAALLAGSLLFLSAILIQIWPQIGSYLRRMDIRLLAAGQMCTIVALLLGGEMWSLIQAAFDLGFSWREGVVVHLVSGITKYIPGYAWQYTSKAYLSQKRGASPKRITMAILTEFVLLLTGGVITAAPWGWLALRLQHPLPLPLSAWGWLVMGVTAALVIVAWNSAVARWETGDRRQVRQGGLWLALGVAIVGWMAFAAAAWLMSRSLYPVSANDFPQYVVALVVSGVISLLVIVVPSGLGVREMTLALLLQGALPLTIGVVVSVLVRFSVILGELAGIGVVLHLGMYRLHGAERGSKRASERRDRGK